MARGGRTRSPSPRASRSAPRTAPRQTQPVPVQAQPPAPMAATPQQPSLFGQMAATAGGVAVGSAIGHTVGHAVTGLFSGSGNDQVAAAPVSEVAQAPTNAYPQEQKAGPCAWEISQFMQCAQQQDDLTLCSGFNEAVRQCKQMNRMV